MSKILTIAGYERDAHCAHCGRRLVHGVRLADGRTVGATCFDQVLTLPRIYNGRKYRIGAENVIRYAKIAESGKLARYGLEPRALDFVAADVGKAGEGQ